ncbi:MAG: DUF2284 domain-containing protein [Bacillota bacterium]|nr:DUF2284 domain-containing protein [Bacillota bacterium]
MSYQEKIEDIISDYFICEYHIIETSELYFSEEVRAMCEENVRARLNRSQAYPPIPPTIEAAKEKCLRFKHGILYNTVTEVRDALDISACSEAMAEHENLAYELQGKLKEEFGEAMALTIDCRRCDDCSCPEDPCHNKDEMMGTIESHGIQIMKTLIDKGICYDYGNKVATYFTLILFNAD